MFIFVFACACVDTVLLVDEITSKYGLFTFVIYLLFFAVQHGYNVMYRNYAYISCTPRNRRSFLNMLVECYKPVISSQQRMTFQDIYSLLLLICEVYRSRYSNIILLSFHFLLFIGRIFLLKSFKMLLI